MPTLDDAPIIEELLTSGLTGADSDASNEVARGDLIQIYDVSEQKVKTITVQALGQAIGASFSNP